MIRVWLSSTWAVSPLFDAIRPLLRVAPAGGQLFDRAGTREVLVYRPHYGIWLTITALTADRSADEYRALEWGPDNINDLRASHFFPSRWELLTWLEALFSAS